MKASFPYMGCVLGYKKLLEKLGHEVIMPPKPTQRTFELGVKYSPEFLCYPFKVMLGTYFQVLEQGVELLVVSGGNGPCRAGYYPEIHGRILEQQGYTPAIITFDSIFRDFKGFVSKLKMLSNKTPVHKIIQAIRFTLKLISLMDQLEKEMKKLRAYEIVKGSFAKAWTEINRLFDSCDTINDLTSANKQAQQILSDVPIERVTQDNRIRVGIVGEIYVIMESSANMNIEQRLNDMGVEVYNVQYISDWVKHNILPPCLNKEHSHKVIKKAGKYSNINCGGHDKENIGWIVDFAERGFDAVVHLMPFSCLPELITRSIIPAMSEDLDMPILSVSIDEQTGAANVQTRLEAFIDLIKSKKQAKEHKVVQAVATAREYIGV